MATQINTAAPNLLAIEKEGKGIPIKSIDSI